MFFRHMLSVLFEIILFIERSGVGGGRVDHLLLKVTSSYLISASRGQHHPIDLALLNSMSDLK